MPVTPASRPRSSRGLASRGIELAALAAIAAAFAASLLMPAIDVSGGPDYSGWSVLRSGWEGARVGVPSWYANPLFLAALGFALARRRIVAGALAGFAVVLALTSPAAGTLAALGGQSLPPLSLGPGYYVWLGAQLALVVWALAPLWLSRDDRLAEKP